MVGFLAALLISFVLNVVAYLIAPKPKGPKSNATKDFENPTADAGRPVPVVFGTITIKGLNILWYGLKSIRSYKVKA